jgi:protein-disulfide isomerase
VRIATAAGRGKQLATWLYEHQERLTTHALSEAVRELVGQRDFERSYRDQFGLIRRDIADGAALSVRATPTIFVNGTRLVGAPTKAFFRRIVSQELRRK